MRRIVAGAIVGACLASACTRHVPQVVPPVDARLPARDSALRSQALHLLNRAAYGPKPGDVDRILAMGLNRYVETQLDSGRAPDSIVARRALAYDVMAPPGDLAVGYEEYQRRQQQVGALNATRTRGLVCQSPDSASLANFQRRVLALGIESQTTHLQLIDRRVNQLVTQYQQVTVLRHALSDRQLYEMLVDFWTNHFNVFVGKGTDRFLVPSYIENTIRPHALGRFEDLLIATATSPAMLVYLDNAQSMARGAVRPRPAPRAIGTTPSPPAPALRCHPGPAAAPPRVPPATPVPKAISGINENYGRELLELHTLGVDGGYSQHDVIDVARIMTGWSVTSDSQGPRFVFNAWAHDRGTKTVLGHRFPAGHDMDEGVALLKILARHPATMRHVSAKLCARLVNDQPPAECVQAAVREWERTGGDLQAVVRAILGSRSFWAPENRQAMFKTPLEFVVSAVRVVGGEPDTSVALAQLVARLGEPLFGQLAPTGYPESQESWINSSALLQRMNTAMSLASGTQPGVQVSLDRFTPRQGAVDSMVAAVNRTILNGAARPVTLHTLADRVKGIPPGEDQRAWIVGLALGSPEFERR